MTNLKKYGYEQSKYRFDLSGIISDAPKSPGMLPRSDAPNSSDISGMPPRSDAPKVHDAPDMPGSPVSPDPTHCVARILAVHRERYEMVTDDGTGTVAGRLKGSEYYSEKADSEFPTVGDFVLIKPNLSGDSLIVKTLPRRTIFTRRDPMPGGHKDQAVAANFDTVFIMMSLNNDFNIRRVERYLTLSWQSGAQPCIILTKADITSPEDRMRMENAIREMAVGVDVIPVSCVTGFGFCNLKKYLKPGKTIAFLGSSGVGKSSLVNALTGSELMAVKEIREDDSHGRHTTTHRQLIMLASGAMVIDTPGMRELGMWDVTTGLPEAFSEINEWLEKCRFADCKHEKEPGCAVRAAIKNGELSAERWQSYVNLKKEARYSDDKAAFMRERAQRHKQIAKWSKQHKKNR